MSDDNRRAGDWQRRDLRENANDLITDNEPNQKPWHRQIFWIVFFLLVFWPVGLILCWKSDWHIAVKIVASIYVVIAIYFSSIMVQAVQQMQLVS